ncbi:hypothetical protein KJK34_04970 [Flavobacterium sp. D11R37]|uniref:DUF6146 family protein n=1 Tax=Flavobacterium coralii TaxID=2838017 RepID=UPI001CA62A8C|nr:DUF6146 family protein [Flavobacterium coralii]MBY8962100.1 hypothetical protein [Flavobacterium coralii]
MKKYIGILLFAIIAVYSCKTQNNFSGEKVADNTKANDTLRIANDSLEYEVIIIDPGFNSWLASRARPRGYYGLPYLENKNQMWVTTWNSRVFNPQQYGELYQMRIDYDPTINYGYEVNYLLYNYLVYFQHTNNQRLGGVVPQY